jgi:hypothetical protein
VLDVVEQLDLGQVYARYRGDQEVGGQPAFDPAMLAETEAAGQADEQAPSRVSPVWRSLHRVGRLERIRAARDKVEADPARFYGLHTLLDRIAKENPGSGAPQMKRFNYGN